MLYDKVNELIYLLSEARGDDGCQEALDKLKEAFGVEKVRDIPEKYSSALINKVKNELSKKNIEEVFKNDLVKTVVCPHCGKEVYKRGMFYICDNCHKIVKEE